MSANSAIFRILLSLLAATGFAASVYIPDQRAAQARQVNEAQRWARQLGAQAEALTLKARELGERDPVGFAVSFLSQGEEPRAVRASKTIQIQENTFSESESLFESRQVLFPQEAEGITFRIPRVYRGFLGAPNRFLNDIGLFLFGLGAFAACMGLFSLRDQSKMRRTRNEGREKIAAWILGAKQLLTLLGTNIRDMIRQAQILALSAFRSRQHIEALRAHLHEGLGGIHVGVKHIRDVSILLQEGEKLAADALARGQPQFDTADFEKFVKSLRAQVAQTQQTLIQLELSMEPLTMEADQAFHALEGVQKTAQKMNESITQTTRGIMDHHQRVEALKTESI